MDPAAATRCPRCTREFVCGIDSGSCWCATVDVAPITRASLAQYYEGCLCRECLEALEGERPPVPSVRQFLASQIRYKRAKRREARGTADGAADAGSPPDAA